MSWLMAAIYDRFMRGMEDACGTEWRRELLSGLEGRVLEIGAGTGVNLAHYPAQGIERLVLAEPDPHMRRKLEAKVASSRLADRAEIVPDAVDALTLPDGAFDAVVSTLVLCSVPDVGRALRSVQRVLRPGGRLVFLEHVAADDDPRRLGWQRRLEPIWRQLAGNCHLCRRTGREIEAAGFHTERLQRESARKALPIVRTTIRGYATKALSAPAR